MATMLTTAQIASMTLMEEDGVKLDRGTSKDSMTTSQSHSPAYSDLDLSQAHSEEEDDTTAESVEQVNPAYKHSSVPIVPHHARHLSQPSMSTLKYSRPPAVSRHRQSIAEDFQPLRIAPPPLQMPAPLRPHSFPHSQTSPPSPTHPYTFLAHFPYPSYGQSYDASPAPSSSSLPFTTSDTATHASNEPILAPATPRRPRKLQRKRQSGTTTPVEPESPRAQNETRRWSRWKGKEADGMTTPGPTRTTSLTHDSIPLETTSQPHPRSSNPFFAGGTALRTSPEPTPPISPAPAEAHERWYRPEPGEVELLMYGGDRARQGGEWDRATEAARTAKAVAARERPPLTSRPRSALITSIFGKSPASNEAVPQRRKLQRKHTRSNSAAPLTRHQDSTGLVALQYADEPERNVVTPSPLPFLHVAAAILSEDLSSDEDNEDDKSGRIWQAAVRSEKARSRELTKAMLIDDDNEFFSALQGLYASELDEAGRETRSAFIVRELLMTERSYARHLARLLKSLDVTQKALPLLAPVEPLTVPDPLLPYLSPISSCDSLSSHSHHQSEVTETQHRPNRTSLPKAEPSAPAHLRLLHWHLQRLLVISIELARRISDDATPYGVGSAFLALEDDAVKVFEEWSQDVVGIFEAIRAVQPVPPPRKLARNHRRRHTMGAETGDESDVARPEASRRKSFVPKRQSSVDPSSTTGCDAMAPPTRGSLSVADVIIQPVQRVARFHLFLRELCKCTTRGDPARALLQRALRSAEALAANCDARATPSSQTSELGHF